MTGTTSLTSGLRCIGGAGNASGINAALDTALIYTYDTPEPPDNEILVTGPVAGSLWQRPNNNQIPIMWNTDGITGNVDLEYSLTGCSGVRYPITTVSYNAPFYLWDADIPASTHVVVFVKQGVTEDCGPEIIVRGQYLR